MSKMKVVSDSVISHYRSSDSSDSEDSNLDEEKWLHRRHDTSEEEVEEESVEEVEEVSEEEIEEVTEEEIEEEMEQVYYGKMSSPHNLRSYETVKWRETLCTFDLAKYLVNCVRSETELPWHIVGDSMFIVDSRKVSSNNDIGTDAFRWDLISTYYVSILDFNDKQSVRPKNDVLQSHRLVKRYYVSRTDKNLTRNIVGIYPPEVKCKGRDVKSYQHVSYCVLLEYKFADGAVVNPA